MHALEQLARSDSLPIRVYAMLPGGDTAVLHAWFNRGADSTNAGNLIVRAIALVADGGRSRYDSVALDVMMTHAWQLVVDAVGSAANRQTLDFIQREMATNSVAAHTRPRIEGAEFVDAKDIPRFVSAGVIASSQPSRAAADLAPMNDGSATAQRAGVACPWRSLRLGGVDWC